MLLPALPLLAAALAVALAESRRLALPWLRTSFLLEATLVLVLTLQGLTLASRWAADPPLPYLAGAESREVYLERHLGAHYRALNHLNQTVSPEASVLLPVGAAHLPLPRPVPARCAPLQLARLPPPP